MPDLEHWLWVRIQIGPVNPNADLDSGESGFESEKAKMAKKGKKRFNVSRVPM